MVDTRNKQPWLVRVHYGMRTMSFAILFVASTAQFIGRGYSPYFWCFLVALLLIYPHLQYWRACRSDDPVKTELNSMVVDSVLLGVFIVVIEFSQWIAFSAVIGTLVNTRLINTGWHGLPKTIVAIFLGCGIAFAIVGFHFSPETNPYSTIFCIICLTSYILAIGHFGFSRNLQLRSIREKLELREQDLITVNENLEKKLHEIDELQNQLQDQANRDPLTGLYNRRYLDATLEREIARCQREGQSLALIMCDIDYFKTINDTYGHQAGDEVLMQFGSMLSIMVRTCDVACRYGGEEFILLLPTMPLDIAMQRAEKLRQMFADNIVEFGDFRLQRTASIGVAIYPQHGKSAHELIKSADRALYDAKAAGRDRVIVSHLD
jgi:diguanylate cyclase (GGDEF)-like protein